MAGVRLNKIAREMNIGVNTLTDSLKAKNPEGEYTPNSKISAEEFSALLKEHGGSLSPEQRQSLLDEFVTKKPAPQPAPTPEEPKKEEHSVGQPKVIGHVNLDSKGNVVREKKPEPASPKVQEVAVEHPQKEQLRHPHTPSTPSMPEAHSDAKKSEPVTPVETKREEAPKAEEVKKTPLREAQPAPVSKEQRESKDAAEAKESKKVESPTQVAAKATEETPVKKEVKPAAASSAKTEEQKSTPVTEAPAVTSLAEPQSTKKADDSFIPIDDELPGVKVVGKVDLSAIKGGTSSRGSRKRSRIKGGKVDIEKQARQNTGDGKSEAGRSGGQKKGDGGNAQGQRNGKSQAGGQGRNNNNAPQQKKGRKAQHAQKQQQQQKPEITQEDIQRQIKETMAAIQGGRRKSNVQNGTSRKTRSEQRRMERELQDEQVEDKKLQLTEYVTANDLAQMIDIPVNEIIMLCFNLGMMVSINQRLEKDTIDLILEEYGYEAEYVEAQMLNQIETEVDADEDLRPRAPIVTVMGHVDHGKTSLLDAIRNTNVIQGEAGGITQHVGAYSVTLQDGRSVTFLDTPGHEAFTAMRARGAKVTDVAIILVAADDGVMPQTKEAISHAALAGVPMVFAINKIDKEGANPERVKQQLAEMNYLVEEWGGKYQSQEIAAKKGLGIEELLEKVLLEAEILDLKANPDKKAVGSVLESTMEQGRGYTTKVLVLEGTLHVGDYILAGGNYGRVKALFNEHGKNVKKVGPSEPVKVLGLNGATQAGEVLNVMDTEAEVRDIATKRTQLKREQRERTQRRPSLMDIGRRIAEGKIKELNIIVKGDMDGTVEALADSVEKLSTDEVRVNVIYKAVGAISESDVVLASASDAIIIGFQVRPGQGAKRIAEEEDVEIRTYSIIYDALDDVKTAMEGLLSPELKERVTANLEVRETFKITKVGTIAGCFVTEGKISRNDKVRIIRDGVVIHTGELASLKRFKDDAKEVVSGLDCGLNINNFNDIQTGDVIEAYEQIEIKRTL